jgi:ubiquinone/menaquinone biosynthesis C-methylase UbiE
MSNNIHPLADVFDNEVRRVITVYNEFEAQGLSKTLWSPFNEIEVAYRSQQTQTFTRLMKNAGFGDLAGLKILDVGCGKGRILRSFVDMEALPHNLYGIDVNDKFVLNALELAPNINYSSFNGWKLEFPDNNFDLVTQYVVFSSIKLLELHFQLSSEMLRVLRPGGYIFWWDIFHMAANAGGSVIALNPIPLFPDLRVKSLEVGAHQSPSQSISEHPKLKLLLGPLLDKLLYRPTHLAALFGPK